MALTLHIHSTLHEGNNMFLDSDCKLKMGEFELSWLLSEDKKHVTIVLENIPSNDQFNLLVQKFGVETEEKNVWLVDLDNCDPQRFMLETCATMTRMYVDMMYRFIVIEPEAHPKYNPVLTSAEMPATEGHEESEEAVKPSNDLIDHLSKPLEIIK